ncbi:SKI family transcriptional corepressor 1 homolog-B-like [Denticeps clupeoides]|uniref:SKI family transcriptional corepressor 1 homolog-B-like n=1 Tax=Denticeps clupeoides TaxID=299321 RepID=UPI0010A381B1|nr:SKI family transcriptional corepressor 1 homolog-B-like [Denticeps clupeoides]
MEPRQNQVGEARLFGTPIVSLLMEGQERLCLAQISNTLLRRFSYNEIHNRRVALGITCVQCTPVQLELLRRAGAMPVSSRRCGMITRREAERLCRSFLGTHNPPRLPDSFAFDVTHGCAWGCRGSFIPARYNSSRAKCIKCSLCGLYFSPNKFIFHSHRAADSRYTQPDAANFNSWRRHLRLTDRASPDDVLHAWEDVKAMFNGGSRKRMPPPLFPRPYGGLYPPFPLLWPPCCSSAVPARPPSHASAFTPVLKAAGSVGRPYEGEDSAEEAEVDVESQEVHREQRRCHTRILQDDGGTLHQAASSPAAPSKRAAFSVPDAREEEPSSTVDETEAKIPQEPGEQGEEELQKQLVEQVEMRKRLEKEFKSLKDNFQDQMKRELSYREEMVQQLQIVREAHDALHHFSCKMLRPCTFTPP